jgi:hypothetical protein
MSSYTYRESDRDWDDYSRPSDHRGSYKVKRYVYSNDDDRERDREHTADRELVIRRRTEPGDDYEIRRECKSDLSYPCRRITILDDKRKVLFSF